MTGTISPRRAGAADLTLDYNRVDQARLGLQFHVRPTPLHSPDLDGEVARIQLGGSSGNARRGDASGPGSAPVQ